MNIPINTTSIHGVIFDLFGTLVDIFVVDKHDRMTDEMARVLGAPPQDFTRLWVESFGLRVDGRLATTEANIAHVLAALDVNAGDEAVRAATQVRWDFTAATLAPKPYALALLDAIGAAGLKRGLISDCSCEVPGLWSDTPFADRFDAALFSCTEGIRKPDPRIYHRATERIGLLPDQILYIGDGGSKELSGAAAVGMMPLLLFEADEAGNHVYRAGAEEWEGDRVASLATILSWFETKPPA